MSTEHNISKVSAEVLLAFAKVYQDLGWAIQEQLDSLLEGNFEGLNPNAVDAIETSLADYCDEIEISCDEFRNGTNKTPS